MCWAALDLWFLGHADRAGERIGQALELAGDPAHSYSLARTHEHVATLHQLRREPQSVLEHATLAIDLGLHQGYEFRAVTGGILRGWARVELGAIDEGLVELRAGIDDYVTSGAEINLPYYIGVLADACLRAGQTAECMQTVDRALEAIVTNSFCYEAELHRLGGVARIERGDEDEGRNWLRQALDIAGSQNALSLELRSATDIARYATGTKERNGANSLLADVRSRIEEATKTPDLVEADSLLGRA